MRVVGSRRLIPTAIVKEKVLESTIRGVEGMLQERQVKANGT
jgi:hypothetical protein